MVNVLLVQFRGIRAVARASDRLPPAHPRVAHSPTNRRTFASEQRCKIAYSLNNMSNVLKNSWACIGCRHDMRRAQLKRTPPMCTYDYPCIYYIPITVDYTCG